MELDLTLRVRVHCLEEALKQAKVCSIFWQCVCVCLCVCVCVCRVRLFFPAFLLGICKITDKG